MIFSIHFGIKKGESTRDSAAELIVFLQKGIEGPIKIGVIAELGWEDGDVWEVHLDDRFFLQKELKLPLDFLDEDGLGTNAASDGIVGQVIKGLEVDNQIDQYPAIGVKDVQGSLMTRLNGFKGGSPIFEVLMANRLVDLGNHIDR